MQRAIDDLHILYVEVEQNEYELSQKREPSEQELQFPGEK